jgi:hypothetical protein
LPKHEIALLEIRAVFRPKADDLPPESTGSAQENYVRVEELTRRNVATEKQREDALATRDQARPDALRDHAALELGKHAHHLEERLAPGLVVSKPC